MRSAAVRRRSLFVLAAALTVFASQPFLGRGQASAATVPNPVQEAIDASAAPGQDWSPGPARYGARETTGVGIRMSDGTVLRATVARPTDPATGQPAAGRFPALLTLTPYGANLSAAGGGTNRYLVEHGYLDIAVDVRGTGASGGRFDLFDPQQTRDAVELVHWAADLPGSTGQVGMHGASYLGIDQLLTAGAVGRDSPLKAIFPLVAANDIYRDAAFMGGIPDLSFDSIYYAGLLPATNLASPLASAARNPEHLVDGVTGTLNHALGVADYNVRFLAQAYLGGDNAYSNSYWRERSPAPVLSKVVDNGIPAYLVGGHHDLFQRGELMNYAALQNAYQHRPVTGPMDPGQPPTGRYQLLQGPYNHLTGSMGASLDPLQLRWFDQWLKGKDSGMDRARTPLHVYDLGTGHYAEHAHYPFRDATPTTYYLGGHSLDTDRPTGTGADPVLWSPVGGTACSAAQDQWTAGVLSTVTNQVPVTVPCVDDARLATAPPASLGYRTAPLPDARTIAGPINVTVYATATTRDTEWVADVLDVAPDGRSKLLAQGALLGSFRELDADRSWSRGGKMIMPYHPYTRASAQPVRPGALTRYDIEVFPTYATVARGHRIQLTLATTDFPHLLPTAPALRNLVGGVYQVHRGGAAPSSVTIPLR